VIPYDDLDPGIRDAVRLLAGHGFQPTDSGDGVSKVDWQEEALPYPHVFCALPDAEKMMDEGRRALSLPWASIGMPPPIVEVNWKPVEVGAWLYVTWDPS